MRKQSMTIADYALG